MKNRLSHPWKLVGLVVLLIGSWCSGISAQESFDERFDSDNKANSVRAPVLAGKIGSFQKIPYKISRAQIKEQNIEPIKSDDLGELNRQEMHDVAVLGKVESVYVTPDGKKLILNIGKDHRFCFKAVIDELDFPKFGVNSAQRIGAIYRGKTVLVSGLIYQYQNLPQIAVTLPYQLEVVAGK